MAKHGFEVLDSDMHILEPADLSQRYIDKKFKQLAPVGTTEHVRDLRLIGPDGRAWDRPRRRDPYEKGPRLFESAARGTADSRRTRSEEAGGFLHAAISRLIER